MNRQFHSLPSPQEVGLRWQPYEHGRAKVADIEQRIREASTQTKSLKERIKGLERHDVRTLAKSLLDGSADPGARTEEIEDLARELREARRLKDALDQVLPEVEEQLRQTAWEHQEEWTSQADKALEEAIKEEREAYRRAQEIAQEARERRLYLEALSSWTRRVPQTFTVPADMTIASTAEQWEQDAARSELRMHERRGNERIEREATGEGAA
jgi:hypothetical protein